MEEKIKTAIEKSLQYLNVSFDEAHQKFVSICEENDVGQEDPLALSLWRVHVSQGIRANKRGNSSQGNDSLTKKCFGAFVALEAPRDMMSWNRNKAKEEYIRDSDKALQDGIVAVATENALGKWTISRYFKGDYQEKVVNDLPEGAEEVNGEMVIPLDSTERYMNGGENRNFGKPLPKEQFRRSGIFYGSVNGQDFSVYQFSYKNQGGIDFQPKTFDWVHFTGIPSEDGKNIYGMTDITLKTLIRNEDLDPENSDFRSMGHFNFQDLLVESFNNHVCALVDIDRKHIEMQTLPSKERFVITDGTVCNMNMTPTSNGNRILNITDLNAEFDYENEAGMTTCWIPEHLDVDFGIGSSIIVIGRTSQRIVDGEADPVTINVSSILTTEKRGSPIESVQPVEENYDWF